MRRRFVLYIVLFQLILSFGLVSAQSLGTADNPPRLRELEALAVQLVYFIWGVSALIFTVLLMIIGARYMLSAGDQQKQQDIKDKGTKWVYGLILVFISYPIVLTFYKVTGIGNNSTCYASIKSPGFHFFFPEICTDPNAESDHAYGNSCSAGDDLGSSQKCCLTSSGKTTSVIMPINAGIRRVESGTTTDKDDNDVVERYGLSGKSNTCLGSASGCLVNDPKCVCNYTYDPSKSGAGLFISGCK